jgi:hypothetical protein
LPVKGVGDCRERPGVGKSEGGSGSGEEANAGLGIEGVKRLCWAKRVVENQGRHDLRIKVRSEEATEVATG